MADEPSGRSVRRKKLGYTAMACERCERPQAFLCEAELVTHKPSRIVETKPLHVRDLVTCDFCGSTDSISVVPPVSTEWSRGQPLALLRDQTNPELALCPDSDRTDTELHALLDEAAERGSLWRSIHGVAVGAGFFGGMMTVTIAASFIEARPSTGLAILAGIALGASAGWWWTRRDARRKVAAFLVDAIAGHRLDPARLRWLCAAPESTHSKLLRYF